jgi:MSHA biogenesis protein MshJ
LGGILIVLFLGWYSYLMEPLTKTQANLLARLNQKHQQLQLLNERFELLTQARHRDPNAANRAKLAKLHKELARVTERVRNTTSTLVSPNAMPDLLRRVLEQSSGLNLLALKGLGSSPLVKPVNAGGAAKGRNGREHGAARQAAAKSGGQPAHEVELANAYKHEMEIQFSGDYFSTLEYMRKLEKLPWGFFWDKVEFKVKKYPQAKASIRLFTLSLDSNWIGT